MKVSFAVKYVVGEKITTGDRVYIVLGYVYVPQRATQYVLLYTDNGETKWLYAYDFEIDALRTK